MNERKLSTKYVGNLKINISSDSSTHQQKAAKIKRNIELQASKEFKKKKINARCDHLVVVVEIVYM